jgi:sulfate transport system substrate-binding protein
VFVVRKGNPKQIKDWGDLAKPGTAVILPNAKTSGNGRYTYLAAWGYGLETTKSESGARDFVADILTNVPVLDGGGRGATTTFAQRGIGDVLVTFENEANLAVQEIGADKLEIVYPSLSIEAPAPVAIVAPVVEKHSSRKLAEAYLNFLYSREGQEIIAKHYFRPRDEAVLKANAGRFPAIRTFSVEGFLGGWAEAQAKHFADGGIYDQIIVKR